MGRGIILAALAFALLASAAMSGPIWDSRLDDIHVTYQPAADCSSGCWHLVEARYEDPEQSAGRVNIYGRLLVDGEAPEGLPWYVAWPTDRARLLTKHPSDTWSNFGMSNSDSCYPANEHGGPYRAFAGEDESRSDVVHGLGLPWCQHVSFWLLWQWSEPARYRVVLPAVRG